MATPAPWLPAPPLCVLPDDEVHVWRVAFDLPPEGLEKLHRTLSPEEVAKAARFHFEKDQRQSTVARGCLRAILGRYLGLAPESLRFRYNAFGKPELDAATAPAPLRFNLAHSGGLVLLAFNRGREIGVDVERIRPNFATDDIAKRFFAPVEVQTLLALQEEARPRAFFNCWTRKEAFIKARGLGLSLPLGHFAVTLAPGESPALLSAQGDAEAPARWTFRDLDAGEGFAAALAVEGRGWQLRCFDVKS